MCFTQHFPAYVVDKFGWHSNDEITEIDVLDAENGETTKCTLKTLTRKSGYVEKYLTMGWYQFVRSKNLSKLDRIALGVENPVDHVIVMVLRHKPGGV
jgi:hypothetical protein